MKDIKINQNSQAMKNAYETLKNEKNVHCSEPVLIPN